MSKNSITPLSKKVSRGFLAEMARKHEMSWTAIQMIADGVNKNHPAIYAEILDEAIRYKKEMEVNAELEKQCQELASQL